MEKVCLLSFRRKEKRILETETTAQRRAREREQSLLSNAPRDVPGFSEDDLEGLFIPEALGGKTNERMTREPSCQHPLDSTPRVELTSEQREVVWSSPILAASVRNPDAVPLLCLLTESPETGTLVLKFSPCPDNSRGILCLKDVWKRLNMSRWSVMRMIREGNLPYYWIANRYFFLEEDLQNYLERSGTHESQKGVDNETNGKILRVLGIQQTTI